MLDDSCLTACVLKDLHMNWKLKKIAWEADEISELIECPTWVVSDNLHEPSGFLPDFIIERNCFILDL